MGAGTLFFRADATRDTGAGHVMRCLSLAQSWKKRGGRAVFIGVYSSESLRERIVEEGFSLVLLAEPYPEGNDLEKTMETIAGQRGGPGEDWLVMDGYHLDETYQKNISSVGIPVLVVDDNHHLDAYHADAIVNPNIYAPGISYQTSSGTLLLLGGRYSLLRAEFAKWDTWEREISEKATRICVTLGGADKENVTGKVLQALALLSGQDLEVRVVVGPANPHLDILREAAGDFSFTVQFLQGVKDMPALMAWADMAVSAAGGTCLELACMGTPALSIITADNQKTNAATFAEADVFATMGWWDSFTVDELAGEIAALLGDQNLRAGRSDRGRRLITSSGADNSIDALLSVSLERRKNDCKTYQVRSNGIG